MACCRTRRRAVLVRPPRFVALTSATAGPNLTRSCRTPWGCGAGGGDGAGKVAVGLFAQPQTAQRVALVRRAGGEPLLAIPADRVDPGLQLSWAMNGRGEFSFLINDEAREEGILSRVDASAVVWALLVSTALAPCALLLCAAVRPCPGLTTARLTAAAAIPLRASGSWIPPHADACRAQGPRSTVGARGLAGRGRREGSQSESGCGAGGLGRRVISMEIKRRGGPCVRPTSRP